MKKTIIIIIVLIVVGVGAYYVFSGKNYQGAPSVSTSVAQSSAISNTTAGALSDVNVSIKNFSFNPSMLSVKTGTKVTWLNNDNVAHTITSDSSNLLNSGTLSPGQSFSFIFDKSGSVNYHCSIHTTMKGTIIVEK